MLTLGPVIEMTKPECLSSPGFQEDETPVKLASLSVEQSAAVSKLLEKKRYTNPIKVWSTHRQSLANISIRKAMVSFAKQRFPPLVWVPQMTCRTLASDLVAGLTVGVMAIPQAMSYASIVGVPCVVGLYTAFVPTVVYAFAGTSRQLVVGPVAMESLLIASGLSGLLTQEECPKWYAQGGRQKSQAQLCREEYTALVFATTFVVGLLEAGTSVFGLGVLLRFMGKPVITGVHCRLRYCHHDQPVEGRLGDQHSELRDVARGVGEDQRVGARDQYALHGVGSRLHRVLVDPLVCHSAPRV